jgi:hypothetical protein
MLTESQILAVAERAYETTVDRRAYLIRFYAAIETLVGPAAEARLEQLFNESDKKRK